MTIYRGKAKCYFQLIQKYEAIIAENQAAFRLKLLEDTMPESLKLRSGQFTPSFILLFNLNVLAMSRSVQIQLRDSLQNTEKTAELMPLVQVAHGLELLTQLESSF